MIEHFYYILDDEGNVIKVPDVETWGLWFDAASRSGARTIARDKDEGPDGREIFISTVFLGLDHRLTGDGPPLLWETLVFGGPLEGEMVRYDSREAALEGHQAMCRRVHQSLSK